MNIRVNLILLLLFLLISVGVKGVSNIADGNVQIVTREYTSEYDSLVQGGLVFLPDDWREFETHQAIVMLHGAGTWEEQKVRWVPYGTEVAKLGFIAVYPQRRPASCEASWMDVKSVIQSLYDSEHLNVDKVGVVAGSFGNISGLSFMQKYPGVADAYIDMYGSLANGCYKHLGEKNIISMTEPILIQVGSEDGGSLQRCSALSDAIDDYNPGLDKTFTIYPNSRHGFVFNQRDGNAILSRAEQIFFWNRTLRG